jgi:GNAT superfamily N-acetyltransferase
MNITYRTNYPTPVSKGEHETILFPADAMAVDRLYATLSPALSFDHHLLGMALQHTYFVTARDNDQGGALVGIGSLHPLFGLHAFYGRIEKVAVDPSIRGQSVAHALFAHLIELALRVQMTYVDLTYAPERPNIMSLLTRLGFRLQRTTNVYRLEFTETPAEGTGEGA